MAKETRKARIPVSDDDPVIARPSNRLLATPQRTFKNSTALLHSDGLPASLKSITDNLGNMHEEFMRLQKAYEDEKRRREQAESALRTTEAHLREIHNQNASGIRYTLHTSMLTKGRHSNPINSLISVFFRRVHEDINLPRFKVTNQAISHTATMSSIIPTTIPTNRRTARFQMITVTTLPTTITSPWTFFLVAIIILLLLLVPILLLLHRLLSIFLHLHSLRMRKAILILLHSFPMEMYRAILILGATTESPHPSIRGTLH